MCDSPLTVYPKFAKTPKGLPLDPNNLEYSYGVPCGKCPPCKKNRVGGWVFRLLQEERVSKSSHFITLTYDTQCIPITKKGYMTLLKKDLTLFFKQLRILQERDTDTPGDHPKIKYYAAGEYGEIKERPHFHIILFNVFNPLNIGKAWKKGQIHIGKSVTGASIAYTAKYIDKAKRIPVHRNDDRQREYSVMSKFLGKSYYENPQIVKYHQSDPLNNYFVSMGGGIKQAMPKYYRKKIFTEKQIQAQNRKIAQLRKEEETTFSEEQALKEGHIDKFYKRSKKRDHDKN